MKIGTWVFVICLCGGSVFTQKSTVNAPLGDDPTTYPVAAVRFEADNVNLLVSQISDKFRIPIGLEVSHKDDLLNGRKILVEVDSGTIKDVLNAFVAQQNIYVWETTDGVVNIFPRDTYRDPILREILRTEVAQITVTNRTSRIDFRKTVLGDENLKKVIISTGLIAEPEVFTSYDTNVLGGNVGFADSNITLRALLNKVIRNSKTKSWIVSRYGEHHRYLLLNF